MARNGENRRVPSHPKTDRISELPDHVLIAILSLLSLKEAGSSHLLSKRWNSLWTYVSCLNFEAMWVIDYLKGFKQRIRYVSWVNEVLQSHQASTLDEFRVNFDPDSKSSPDIDNWIEFAIQKRVQRLEVGMKATGMPRPFPYKFPDKVSVFIQTPRGLSCIRSLTSLSLDHVNITSQQLEHFLSNSPLLERLCVIHSPDLTILKVEGPTLRLKFLELYMCWSLECVKIFAPNLISFIFYGGRLKPRLYIKHAPSLVQVSALSLCQNAVDTFCPLLDHFSHLQTLTLTLTLQEGTIVPSKSLVFTCLGMLILRLTVLHAQSLFDWIPVIERAPSLHTFSLQFEEGLSSRERKMKLINFKHENLRMVQLVGFNGFSTDIEVAKYLLEVAVVLDKLVIDRRAATVFGILSKLEETDFMKEKKERALGLKTKLPRGVELVII